MSLRGTMSAVRARRSVPKPQIDSYGALELGMNPLALWRFSELSGAQITDHMPGARHLTITGQAIRGLEGLPVNSDAATDFAGLGSASRSHDSGLALPVFTLFGWLMGRELVPDIPRLVVPFSKENAAGPTAGDFRLMWDEGEGFIRLRVRDAALANHTIDSPIGSFPTGQRHCICIRADSTGFRLRFNGAIIGTITAYTGGWSVNAQPLRWAINAIDNVLANIVADEWLLFARALTDSEELQLAQRSGVAPIANNDAVNVSESATTVIDVTANDSFVGAKSNLTLELFNGSIWTSTVTTAHGTFTVRSDKDIDFVAGSVTQDEAVSAPYRITDTEGTSNTATINVTVLNGVAPTADTPFFGLAIGDDCPNVGPSNSRLHYSDPNNPNAEFFWAERTGIISHVRTQWRMNNTSNTYSQGNGGTYTIQIRPANGTTKKVTAGSAAICSITGVQPVNDINGAKWRQYEFTLKGSVTKGQAYVLCFINTASNPTSNYVSCNHSLYLRGDGPPAGGWSPIILPAGLAGAGEHQRDYPGFWNGRGASAVLDSNKEGQIHSNLRYSDGQWVGCGNAGTMSPPRSHPVQGDNMVRHRFRPWRTHVVNGAWVFIQRRNATTGTLTVTLEQGPASATSGNGSQIAQATLSGSQLVDLGDRFEIEAGHLPIWQLVTFSQQTLNAGTIYTIRLSASSSLDCRQNAGFRRQGSASDDWSQAFDDFPAHEAGQTLSWNAWEYSLGLQVSTNGGTSWSYPFGANRQTCPLLLRCVP